MKVLKISSISLLAALICMPFCASGQIAAGRAIRMSDFSVTDMMQFSQYDFSFGTARSAAMGGAFSSLGADISSMALNPAGLGMYRSSEFSISPSMMWNNSKSSFTGDYVTGQNDDASRFTIGSFGFALNTVQAASGMVSFTFGFGYQKLADFNTETNIGLDGQSWSITDIFSRQLDGIAPGDLSSSARPFRNTSINPNQWGAVLGWQTRAVNEKDPDGNSYAPMLWDDALTDNYMVNKSVGSIGEYDLSVGMNFNNRLYLGFTLGLQDIYNKQMLFYSEEYYNQDNVAGDPMLSYMDYTQYVRYTGTGVNFKFGIIVRPVDALRIGLAVHSPTFVTMSRQYNIADMYTRMQDGNALNEAAYSDYLQWDYNFTTPTRLIAGLSYQVGNIAILSADYERVWYNGMRLGSSDDYFVPDSERDIYKSDVKYAFRPANNFRAGIEIKPVSQIALRAGYAYYDGGIQDKAGVAPSDRTAYSLLDNPVVSSTTNYSAGVGYRTGNFSIDAAYIYSQVDYTKYAMFWYGDSNRIDASSGPVSTSIKRNLLTISLGFRF